MYFSSVQSWSLFLVTQLCAVGCSPLPTSSPVVSPSPSSAKPPMTHHQAPLSPSTSASTNNPPSLASPVADTIHNGGALNQDEPPGVVVSVQSVLRLPDKPTSPAVAVDDKNKEFIDAFKFFDGSEVNPAPSTTRAPPPVAVTTSSGRPFWHFFRRKNETTTSTIAIMEKNLSTPSATAQPKNATPLIAHPLSSTTSPAPKTTTITTTKHETITSAATTLAQTSTA